MFKAKTITKDAKIFKLLGSLDHISNIQALLSIKVFIHKSRGEVSLVEQDRIENVSAAYLKFMINF
jgi:hypothetical protein